MNIHPTTIARVREQFLPEFAPLPAPFLDHLLRQDSSHFNAHYLRLKSTSTPEEEFLERIWRQFIYFRSVIYNYVAPPAFAEQIARDVRLSSHWLQQTLTHVHSSGAGPSIKTISDWHVRHLLRYRSYDVVDPNSASAILTLRYLLPTKTRGWLPSLMKEDEPPFWVWSMLPGAAPKPSPVSQIDQLPAHTLLWTTWPGAAFDRSWVIIPARGALRWAGRTSVYGFPLWHLSGEAIEAWQGYDMMGQQHLRELEQGADHFPHLADASKNDLQKIYFHLLAEEMLRRIGIPQLLETIRRFYGQSAPTLYRLLTKEKKHEYS